MAKRLVMLTSTAALPAWETQHRVGLAVFAVGMLKGTDGPTPSPSHAPPTPTPSTSPPPQHTPERDTVEGGFTQQLPQLGVMDLNGGRLQHTRVTETNLQHNRTQHTAWHSTQHRTSQGRQ